MKNRHVLTMFAIAMLAYQAWRTMDYMSGSLQGVSETTRMLVSVAFLAFSEIGLLIWLHAAQPSATTELQETTATVMIWTDFVGSMIIGLGDLLKHNTIYIIDLSIIDPLLFLAPWVIVVLNVGGYLIYHSNDAEEKLEREERRLKHAEIKLELGARREAIRELEASKQEMAEKLAPTYYREIRNRVEGRTLARFERVANQPKLKAPADTAILNTETGNHLAEQPEAGSPNGHSREGK